MLIHLGSRLLIQKNLKTSLCDSLILICQNVLSMSPYNNIGLNLEHINISHKEFCKAGPVFRHSSKKAETSLALTKSSHAVRSFVASARLPNQGAMWKAKYLLI